MSGDYYDQNYKYIAIKLYECSGDHCAPQNEIEQFFRNKILEIHYMDTYTNKSDSENFINTYMETRYHYKIIKNWYHTVEYFLQEAEVEE